MSVFEIFRSLVDRRTADGSGVDEEEGVVDEEEREENISNVV